MDVTELAQMLESTQAAPVSEEEFQEAVEAVKVYKLEDDQKLQLYGLYKQATIGDINTSQPMFFNFVARSKWDAWKAYEGFPMESAKMAYVFIVNQFEANGQRRLDGSVASKPSTDESSMSFLGAVSTLMNGSNDPSQQWSPDQQLFKFVVEENIDELTKLVLEKGLDFDINAKSEEGLTALHYAADRGFLAGCRLLVESGADRSATDEEGQTPLDYAVMCEHEEVIEYLTTI